MAEEIHRQESAVEKAKLYESPMYFSGGIVYEN